jgi:uncharacterized damage-inducible protein DinB
MLIKVAVENNNEDRSIAWALDLPGCFAYGSNETEALIRIPQAILAFKNWLDGYSETSWLKDLGDFDIRLVETFNRHFLNKAYEPDESGELEVSAWFHHDWLPLTDTEIEQALQAVTWAHNDLKELVSPLDNAQLDLKLPEQRWSIRGILRHVANAEWWYLDRLNLANERKDQLPEDVFARMQATLDNLYSTLPEQVGNENVRGREGEFWSPRKVLRRSAWHALDHCQHIHSLITRS